jgi:hypothetical protein
VNQTLTVDGADGHTAHVGIPRDVVEVVESEDATGERLEKPYPFGLAMIFLAVFLDRKSDVFRSQFLAVGKWPAGATPQLPDDVTKMFLNDGLS